MPLIWSFVAQFSAVWPVDAAVSLWVRFDINLINLTDPVSVKQRLWSKANANANTSSRPRYIFCLVSPFYERLVKYDKLWTIFLMTY